MKKRITGQLATASKDLEKFAYSASYGQRMPLRAIDGFFAAGTEK